MSFICIVYLTTNVPSTLVLRRGERNSEKEILRKNVTIKSIFFALERHSLDLHSRSKHAWHHCQYKNRNKIRIRHCTTYIQQDKLNVTIITVLIWQMQVVSMTKSCLTHLVSFYSKLKIQVDIITLTWRYCQLYQSYHALIF